MRWPWNPVLTAVSLIIMPASGFSAPKTLLQINNNHPVGAAGAVNGSGSSILEDIDALYIVGINPFDGRNGGAIHNKERIRARINGADAPDNNPLPFYHHPGAFPLNHLINVPVRMRGVLVDGNTGNRRGEISAGCLSIPDVHHLRAAGDIGIRIPFEHAAAANKNAQGNNL